MNRKNDWSHPLPFGDSLWVKKSDVEWLVSSAGALLRSMYKNGYPSANEWAALEGALKELVGNEAVEHGLAPDGGVIPPQTLICGWCGNHREGYVQDGVTCSCGGNSWMVCTLGCLKHEKPAAGKA